MPSQKFFGECLRAFKLGRLSTRSEAAQACCLESINYANYEWRLRADDGEIDGLSLREGD